MEQLEFIDSPSMLYFLAFEDKLNLDKIREEQDQAKSLPPFQISNSKEISNSVISSNRVSNPLYTRIEGVIESVPLLLDSRRPQKCLSKKGSLKFCRRLCKSVVPLLEREAFSMSIFAYFGTLMTSFLGSLNSRLKDRERLDAVSRLVFHRMWKKNRELLACTHNNKICLVTQNEWDSFFGSEGFVRELGKDEQGLEEILDLIEFKDDLNKEIFKSLFTRSMFILNVVFINTIIHCDMNKDEKFLKSVPNNEIFAMIVIEPWLCKHFNHAKEKFALECCNKCKICRSGTVPPDFLFRLQRAREKLKVVKDFYNRFNQSNVIDFTEEQVVSLFMFWGTQVAI